MPHPKALILGPIAEMPGSDRRTSVFGGLSHSIAAACGCLLFALVAFVGVQQSPDETLLWTGTKVIGSEQHGVVSYTWDHRQYSIGAPSISPDNIPIDVNKPRVTLYLDPANPSHAVTDSTETRISEGLLIGGPLALGVLILIIGVLRRRVARRNFAAATAAKSAGMDSAPRLT